MAIAVQQAIESCRGRSLTTRGPAVLHIGLVNNMPDPALEQSERQLFRLFGSASGGLRIRWHLFSLKSIPRGQAGRLHLMHQNYHELRDLYRTRLDGVVVTGAEPLQMDFREEAYWPELSELLDWVDREGPPAILSCLAAHAAVFRYDGIARKRLLQKRCGVFDHIVVNRHTLTSALESPVRVAHSRWNELPAEALEEAGYRVLTYSAEAGVDAFLKQTRNLMLFFQGHPEYERDTLAREYRRDVRRFLTGESVEYPALPQHYFRKDEIRALSRFRKQALANRKETEIDQFPAAIGRAWCQTSNTLPVLTRWLRYVAELSVERSGLPPARLMRAGLHA